MCEQLLQQIVILAFTLEIEKEADNFAFDTLMKEYDEPSKQLTSILAIQFVLTSSCLLEPNKSQTIQYSHPTLDNRLFYFLQKINTEKVEHDFYIKYIVYRATNVFRKIQNFKYQ